MRYLSLLVLLLFAASAAAQLRVENPLAGSRILRQAVKPEVEGGLDVPFALQLSPVFSRPLGVAPASRVRAHMPYAVPVATPVSPAFDFAAAKPYLAFFCRLELDIEEATRMPVRFRLGEVRTWQQELSKRE